MKVLHLVKTAVGATWAYDLVRALCTLGVDVAVALPSDTEGLAPYYRAAGATVLQADLDVPARHPWHLPRTVRTCRELVEQMQPDLIHSHHVGTTLVLRLALGRRSSIPRIFGVNGTLHLEHDFFSAADTRFAGPQDYWIATCRWTRSKYLELGIAADHVFLAYLGTDVDAYPSKRTGSLRRQLGVAPEVPLVGMVSYLYAPKWFLGCERGHKGHEDFIAALARVREELPDVRGVIIGGPWGSSRWYEDRVRYLGERLCDGGLAFFGTRRDVRNIYPDLDLAVAPSLSDGLAYSVVEPLLGGVPVIATNVGGLPDLVRDGETGWLVPPSNPAALALAMREAFDDPKEARRRAIEGRKLARNLMTLERTGREVVAIYETILRGSRRPN